MTEQEVKELKELLFNESNDVNEGIVNQFVKKELSDLANRKAARIRELVGSL